VETTEQNGKEEEATDKVDKEDLKEEEKEQEEQIETPKEEAAKEKDEEETIKKPNSKNETDAINEADAIEEDKGDTENAEIKKEENEGDETEVPKEPEEDEEEFDEEEEEVEELYVKFKGYSYLHCEWKTMEELDKLGDKRVLAKLNRWKQKFGETIITVPVEGEEDEQEYFNEDYTVVARVLDETYDDVEKQHYVCVIFRQIKQFILKILIVNSL
jgi:chromodomain-helicase-DNA-binding protein 7